MVINKDPAISTSQMEIPESKPEVDLSSISTTKPLGNLFGATIRSLVPPKAEQTRSLVPPKAEQINTVSTTATRQVCVAKTISFKSHLFSLDTSILRFEYKLFDDRPSLDQYL